MLETQKRIATVCQECHLQIDLEEELKRVNAPQMMDVAYSWAKGKKFVDIKKMTKIFEGSIVRVIRRLEEMLRQLSSAAKSIGDSGLVCLSL